MSDLNSWEDDPAAQDENLARQAQQHMNIAHGQQGAFRPGAAAFQPTAQTFQPGQSFGGANFAHPQYQQQQYYGGGQPYVPPGYGGHQGYGQYGNQGYAGVYGQGNYNQGYGMLPTCRLSVYCSGVKKTGLEYMGLLT